MPWRENILVEAANKFTKARNSIVKAFQAKTITEKEVKKIIVAVEKMKSLKSYKVSLYRGKRNSQFFK